jgi:hypothetical protein
MPAIITKDNAPRGIKSKVVIATGVLYAMRAGAGRVAFLDRPRYTYLCLPTCLVKHPRH